MKPETEKIKDLQDFRKEIDRIDGQIIELLEERFDVAQGIIRYKQRRGIPILDAGREKEKLEGLASLCTEDKRSYIAEILQETMAQSRRYQEEHPLRYGLLGRTLGHSHSPEIHRILGDYEYGLFEREPEGLTDFFASKGWSGINVTIPYKRDVMAFCDELSETAIRCNSVNTIVRWPAGGEIADAGTANTVAQRTASDPAALPDAATKASDSPEASGFITYGTNTDYDGFRYVVQKSGIDVRSRKTLVLGSGGVSGTVVQVMRDLGADPIVIISRTGENNYENLHRHADAKIIVNTTPVGMYPKAGEAALNIAEFPELAAVYDLIYNPLRTKLMLDAEKAGVPAFGGLPMLVGQAAKALQLFAEAAGTGEITSSAEASTSVETPFDETADTPEIGAPHERQIPTGPIIPEDLPEEDWIRQALDALQLQQENIVLIGMPGVGKTTVGHRLARLIGKRFADTDYEIRNRVGRTAEEIIREDGIDRFREIETEVLRSILREEAPCKGSLVLATGGGIVEREENRQLLRENSLVIWLKRPINELPTHGRPVSQADGLQAIHDRRAPLYEAWSDLQVDGIGERRTAERIAELLTGDTV